MSNQELEVAAPHEAGRYQFTKAPRDYAGEMRELIDKVATGEDAPPLLAAQLVTRLRAEDPELLQGWLDEQAVQFLRHAINLRDAAIRTHNRRSQARSVFSGAVAAFHAGNRFALQGFQEEHYSVANGVKKPFGQMTHNDLLYAAEAYGRRKDQNALQEAFLLAVAQRVGQNQVVQDVFDEAQLRSMGHSLI